MIKFHPLPAFSPHRASRASAQDTSAPLSEAHGFRFLIGKFRRDAGGEVDGVPWWAGTHNSRVENWWHAAGKCWHRWRSPPCS